MKQMPPRRVTQAAENNGPMMFARIGMMQAINRHRPKEFDPPRKHHRWGNSRSMLAREFLHIAHNFGAPTRITTLALTKFQLSFSLLLACSQATL